MRASEFWLATGPWKQVLRYCPEFSSEDVELPDPDAIQDGMLCVRSHLDSLSGLAEDMDEDDEFLDEMNAVEQELARELYSLQPFPIPYVINQST